jgi:hypothetical protein
VDAACAQSFIERLASRAYRRPLDQTDRAALAKLYAVGAQTSTADGVRLVIEGVLQSPSFLYRTELGSNAAPGKPVVLTPYELASALSFFLLNSIPDEALWAAAQNGSLGTDAGFTRELTRLMGDPRVRANLGKVFLKWMGLGGGVSTELPSDQYPEYDDNLKASLAEEATRFFDDLLANGGSISDLLTSKKTFVDQRLAALYGVAYPGGTGFVPVTLPADQRSGILTQAGRIVTKSYGQVVVHRGKSIKVGLLCGVIPAPPPGINTMIPPSEANLSNRQLAMMRMADSVCGPCHSQMDPLGLAFENYDALGRYSAKDAQGNPVDASATIAGTDVDGTVKNAVDLGQRLVGSADMRVCLETNMQAYALGRDVPSTADQCEQQNIDQQVKASGGKLLDMMRAIAAAPGFRTRVGGQ